jgi:Uma2 family endonuclease
MSTTTHISEEQYLRTFSWEPDAEYVEGEIRTRSMPTYSHADWQQAITAWFVQHGKEWNIRCVRELRVRVAIRRYRIPDVTVLDRANPREEVVTVAPLAVFEVLSPEDRMQEMYEKLDAYAAMGIPQIWIVDPKTGAFKQYADDCLRPATRFEMRARGIQFELREIAALLQD